MEQTGRARNMSTRKHARFKQVNLTVARVEGEGLLEGRKRGVGKQRDSEHRREKESERGAEKDNRKRLTIVQEEKENKKERELAFWPNTRCALRHDGDKHSRGFATGVSSHDI